MSPITEFYAFNLIKLNFFSRMQNGKKICKYKFCESLCTTLKQLLILIKTISNFFHILKKMFVRRQKQKKLEKIKNSIYFLVKYILLD